MEPMSFWQLVENSPEWVGVFANAIFAITTITVIIWQVCVMKVQVRVMKWQVRSSARHEHIQNRLIRLQHEHEWVIRKNQEREQILKLGRKLHLDLGVLQHPSETEATIWGETQDTMYELEARLRILDVALCGEHDNWFITLEDYVEAVVKIVIADPNDFPSEQTKQALHDAEQHHNPTAIFLNIEEAIRMEFFDFKDKWDGMLK